MHCPQLSSPARVNIAERLGPRMSFTPHARAEEQSPALMLCMAKWKKR